MSARRNPSCSTSNPGLPGKQWRTAKGSGRRVHVGHSAGPPGSSLAQLWPSQPSGERTSVQKTSLRLSSSQMNLEKACPKATAVLGPLRGTLATQR